MALTQKVHQKLKKIYFSSVSSTHLFGELAGLIRAGHDLVVEDREVEGKAQPGKKCKVLTN